VNAPETKRGRGRPPNPEGPREDVIHVRVLPEERAVVEAAAEREGVTVASWAREALMAAAERAHDGARRRKA
jgi:uncharacterized protein (DUF1778 family)